MPDGRTIDATALDRLVAERVMGYTIERTDAEGVRRMTDGYAPDHLYRLLDGDGRGEEYIGHAPVRRYTEEDAWASCPRFSTDIGAAWRIVERLNADGHVVMMMYQGVTTERHYGPRSWYLAIGRPEGEPARAEEATAPLAICLAALRALGVDVHAELTKLKP